MKEENEQGPFIAELGRRAVASALDYFIFSFFYALLLINFGSSEIVDGKPEYYLQGYLRVVPFIVWFFTFPVMESIEGQTLGKRILKLKVVRLDLQPLTFLDSLKRRIVDWIDFALLGLPAIISSKNSSYRQRIGDRFAQTTVIDTRVLVEVNEE